MPSTTPSPARLRAVIEAMKSAGQEVAEIAVSADGSFRVIAKTEDERNTASPVAKKWPKAS